MTSTTNLIEEALAQNPDEVFSSRQIRAYAEYSGRKLTIQQCRDKLASLRLRGTVVKVSHGHYQAGRI